MDSVPLDYGISRVSGYYGPGAVLGWWLLIIATTLNVIYGDVSPSHSNAPERPSIWNLFNLDPNILAIAGYPFIASLDLLANMHSYSTNPNNPALFRAPFLLIMEGKLALYVIMIVLAVRFGREGEHQEGEHREGEHREGEHQEGEHSEGGCREGEHCLVDTAFLFIFLAYFAMVQYALTLACIEKFRLFAFNSLFPLVPYSWKDGASRVSVCQTNIDSYLKRLTHPNWEEGVSNKDWDADNYETTELLMRSLSVFIIIGMVALYRANRVDLVKALGCWDVRTLALQAVLVVCCYAVFLVAARQFSDLFMLASEFLMAPILSTHQWGGLIPKSGASLYDLDQAAALVVGGVLPLVLSVKPMLRQVLVRSRNQGAQAAETGL